jgi:hypothetical protein
MVSSLRRAIAEALVLAFLVVEVKPGANARLGLGHRRISFEVDLLVFQAAPPPLVEDVVHAAALAVYADRDPMPLQRVGEGGGARVIIPRPR